MGASTRTTPTRDLIAEINELRTQRHAAILAHNYQRPEIQDIADVVADSLAMARRADPRNLRGALHGRDGGDRESGETDFESRSHRRLLARQHDSGGRCASLACDARQRARRRVREYRSRREG